jgi:hypothetical protein
MSPLYTEEEFFKAKSRDTLPLKCEKCNKIFYKLKRYIVDTKRKGSSTFCSLKCYGSSITNKKCFFCTNCNLKILKNKSQKSASISGNSFCSKSCAAFYNNTHKTKGTRRSKLEIWMEDKLKILYPKLNIFFNDKTTINSELDIYFSDFKIAFELNGIFHYEPIYGENKLNKIKNNDNRKFQACLEKQIELCIIDTSKLIYFKEQTANKYLEIIIKIINKKMEVEVGFEPTEPF